MVSPTETLLAKSFTSCLDLSLGARDFFRCMFSDMSLFTRSNKRVNCSYCPYLCLQRWCGTHRLLHRDWCHDGTYQAREDCRHIWARYTNARPEELHGANRGSVRLYTRRAPGGRQLRHHRSARQKPLCLHPETDADRRRGERDRHGAGVQGTNTQPKTWIMWTDSTVGHVWSAGPAFAAFSNIH